MSLRIDFIIICVSVNNFFYLSVWKPPHLKKKKRIYISLYLKWVLEESNEIMEEDPQ